MKDSENGTLLACNWVIDCFHLAVQMILAGLPEESPSCPVPACQMAVLPAAQAAEMWIVVVGRGHWHRTIQRHWSATASGAVLDVIMEGEIAAAVVIAIVVNVEQRALEELLVWDLLEMYHQTGHHLPSLVD